MVQVENAQLPKNAKKNINLHPSDSTDDDDGVQDENPRHPKKKAKKNKKNKKVGDYRPLTEADAMRLKIQKEKARSKWRERRAEKNQAQFSHYSIRPSIQEKYVAPATPIFTTMDTSKTRVATTAYVGLNDRSNRDNRSLPLSAFVGEDSEYNFQLVPWDGK